MAKTQAKQVIPFSVTTGPLPASRKIHVNGIRYQGLKVAMREIKVSGNRSPVVVYDPSGPYTDEDVDIDIYSGLPQLRKNWIKERGDVETYIGRKVKPEDNGLTGIAKGTPVQEFPEVNPTPLRAKDNKAVTQLAYARAGIITKEMEYIAIREMKEEPPVSSLQSPAKKIFRRLMTGDW